jgi:hypothetical protein
VHPRDGRGIERRIVRQRAAPGAQRQSHNAPEVPGAVRPGVTGRREQLPHRHRSRGAAASSAAAADPASSPAVVAVSGDGVDSASSSASRKTVASPARSPAMHLPSSRERADAGP